MKHKGIGLWVALMTLALSGCLQSQEHLYVQDDGAGRLETHLVVPAGTLMVVEKTFGGLMQSLAEGFGTESVASPESGTPLAEKLFANKDDLLEKARKSGVTVEVVRFESVRQPDALTVDTIVSFDDVHKFLSADIMGIRVDLRKTDAGDWEAVLPSDPQRMEEARSDREKFEAFRESGDFKGLDPAQQEQILSAMRGLQVELALTLPFEIKEMSSAFAREDPATVKVGFGGDLLADPETAERFYAQSDKEERVVWDAGRPVEMTLDPPPPPAPVADVAAEAPAVTETAAPEAPAVAAEGIKVYLKDGRIIEGPLVEQTPEFIKIDQFGVPIVYYQDEILKTEQAVP